MDSKCGPRQSKPQITVGTPQALNLQRKSATSSPCLLTLGRSQRWPRCQRRLRETALPGPPGMLFSGPTFLRANRLPGLRKSKPNQIWLTCPLTKVRTRTPTRKMMMADHYRLAAVRVIPNVDTPKGETTRLAHVCQVWFVCAFRLCFPWSRLAAQF